MRYGAILCALLLCAQTVFAEQALDGRTSLVRLPECSLNWRVPAGWGRQPQMLRWSVPAGYGRSPKPLRWTVAAEAFTAQVEEPASPEPSPAKPKTSSVKPAATDGDGGMTMSDKAVDDFLNGVFEKSRKLTVIKANLTERVVGGAFKVARTNNGTLQVALPRSFRLEMLGGDTGASVTQRVVGDGTYIWMQDNALDAPDEVERYLLKSFESGGSEGKGFDLASMFLGTEVKDASEVRRDFTVTGARLPENRVEITMLPKQGKMTESLKSLLMRFRDGEEIPEYVCSVMPALGIQKPRIIERTIAEVQTNLTGLSPFPKVTFAFPLEKSMTVLEKSKDGGEKRISYDDAKQDIQRALDKATETTKDSAPKAIDTSRADGTPSDTEVPAIPEHKSSVPAPEL